MANIKNLAYFLGLTFAASCTRSIPVENPSTIQSDSDKVVSTQRGPVGAELFQLIRDTVSIKPLTSALLQTYDWEFYPGDKCVSSYSFKMDFKGTGYDCEVMDEFHIEYHITKDTLNIEQYERPNVGAENKMVKTRDDKYVYDGSGLILVDSKMYSNGKTWTPEIEIVIKYHRKKY